jgi:hypothetical protein
MLGTLITNPRDPRLLDPGTYAALAVSAAITAWLGETDGSEHPDLFPVR